MNARLERHAAVMRLRTMQERFDEIMRMRRSPARCRAALEAFNLQVQADYKLIGKETPKKCSAPIMADTQQQTLNF
jgi:outer membrane protein assembly factor BamD (BamD/ComL family)